jgi:hypothetical protein
MLLEVCSLVSESTNPILLTGHLFLAGIKYYLLRVSLLLFLSFHSQIATFALRFLHNASTISLTSEDWNSQDTPDQQHHYVNSGIIHREQIISYSHWRRWPLHSPAFRFFRQRKSLFPSWGTVLFVLHHFIQASRKGQPIFQWQLFLSSPLN